MGNSVNSGFEAYKIYRALKSHFNQKKYDFNKFKGNTVRVVESWNALPCRKLFTFYGKKLNSVKLKNFFISNFLNDKNYFPVDYDKEYEVYIKWLGRIESIRYGFMLDVKKVKKFIDKNNLTIDNVIKERDGKLPILLHLVFKDIISIESFIILDNIFHVINNCRNIRSDIKLLYEHRIIVIQKYKLFFNIKNIDEYKKILLQIFKG